MNAPLPSQPTRRFRALYTKHVRQKNKVYHDGIVLLRPSSVLLSLADEAGRTLSVASAPAPAEQHPASHPFASGLTVFDGFLVDLEGEEEGEGREGGGGAAAAGGRHDDVSAAAPAPLSLPFPPRSRVPAFRAPLRTVPQPQQQQRQRDAAATPPPAQYQQHEWKRPEGRRVPRSDDEILGLLSGSLGAPPPPPAHERTTAATTTTRTPRLGLLLPWRPSPSCVPLRRGSAASTPLSLPLPREQQQRRLLLRAGRSCPRSAGSSASRTPSPPRRTTAPCSAPRPSRSST